MIISHKYRFIFVKTRKTAGTSIEIALRPHLGPDDVATPVHPDDEAYCREHGIPGPQNYIRPFSQYRLYDWRRLLLDRKRQDFKNHLPGPRIRQMIPKQIWDSYYKFTVERNPWDKVISGYYWTSEIRKRESREPLSLDAFLQGHHIYDYKDWHRYAEGHDLIVDRVLRFEELDTQLAEVCRVLGLPALTLPNAKGGIRTDKLPALETLGDNVDRISEVFAEELEILGV